MSSPGVLRSLTLLLVRKLVVICSGRMEPSLARTVAEALEEEVSLLLGEKLSQSTLSLPLLASERLLGADGFRKVAEKSADWLVLGVTGLDSYGGDGEPTTFPLAIQQ